MKLALTICKRVALCPRMKLVGWLEKMNSNQYVDPATNVSPTSPLLMPLPYSGATTLSAPTQSLMPTMRVILADATLARLVSSILKVPNSWTKKRPVTRLRRSSPSCVPVDGKVCHGVRQ